MNERIKELKAQCWKQVTNDFDMKEGGLSTISTVFDTDKFAELIWHAAYEEGHDAGVDAGFEAGRKASFTEQNFGVEE